jgi:hypothetical protein
MNLTFVDDYSSDVVLDTQLTGVSDSGVYFNRGVHPYITIDNIIQYLPARTITLSAYNALTTYGDYMITRQRSDIVTSGGLTYQSIASGNKGNTPVSSPTKWVVTNENSIKIKTEIFNAEDSLIQALSLNRKLVENQYIYDVGKTEVTLQGDFSGWAFEPKGSDHVKIRINQMSLQAMTVSDVNVYVVNQGVLLQTLVLHPNNGLLEFEDVVCTLSGKGVFYLVFPSQEVLSNNAYNDPLRYTGFICYPVQGIGSTAASSVYKDSVCSGLNFNVSVYTDTTTYVLNNMVDFAKALQSQFELNMLKMFHSNPHIQITRNSQNMMDNGLLYNEIMGIEGETVVKKYKKDIKEALEAVNKTYDKMTRSPALKIKTDTI